MKKKVAFVLVMILVATGITALVGLAAGGTDQKQGKRVVTSFYPVYLLAQKVAEGARDVEVWNLTSNHSGCLHDYTLKTQDMRLLSSADLFLVNGGGMELFLEKAVKECRGLTVADTSEGFDFLEGVEHSHDHGEQAGDADHDSEDDHDHEGNHGHGEVNAHLWLDLDGYLLQLSRIEEAFCNMDPAQAVRYHANAAEYRAELLALQQEYAEAGKLLKGQETVVFHEGFVYLMNMLGIETLHCLPMDSETQISAGEAAEIVEECTRHGVTALFVTEDYAQIISRTFGTESGCEAVVLHAIDGAAISSAERDGKAEYIDLMRENLQRIKAVYGLK